MSDTASYISVDIGATKTVVARWHKGSIEPLDRFPTDQDPEKETAAIVATLAGTPGTDDAAVGIGCPGPLDPKTGTILEPPNLKEWKDYPLADELSRRLNLPVRLENDANVGALGEAIYGSGQGYDSVFYLTLSTGIGAGLIVDGKIHDGHRAMAGEVWALDTGALTGDFQGRTILERASGPGLIRSVSRRLSGDHADRPLPETILTEEELDTLSLFAAYDDGDLLAKEVVEDGQAAIAGLLLMVLLAVAPDALVLAGGLCTESRWFVDPVIDIVRRNLPIPELRDVPITRAKLWDQAVLYGAAYLAEYAGTNDDNRYGLF